MLPGFPLLFCLSREVYGNLCVGLISIFGGASRDSCVYAFLYLRVGFSVLRGCEPNVQEKWAQELRLIMFSRLPLLLALRLPLWVLAVLSCALLPSSSDLSSQSYLDVG